MRSSARLLATVGRSSQYLTPGAPTGLTGVYTHPTPRPHLLWLYTQTLEKVKAIPESSVYRQSLESLTKHRMKIIEGAVPRGFDEWQTRITKFIKERPEVFEHDSIARHFQLNGKTYVLAQQKEVKDDRDLEFDGDVPETQYKSLGDEAQHTGSTLEETAKRAALRSDRDARLAHVEVENEPPLTALQVEDVEKEIGGGLLEEVLLVAEGELDLVDTIIKSRAWEELEEKPVEGQWQYFERAEQVMSTETA